MKQYRPRLSEETVMAIYEEAKTDTQHAIAIRHGIGHETVSGIVRGRLYRRFTHGDQRPAGYEYRPYRRGRSTKLTPEEVLAIFHDSRKSRVVAEAFRVSRETVKTIWTKRRWTKLLANEIAPTRPSRGFYTLDPETIRQIWRATHTGKKTQGHSSIATAYGCHPSAVGRISRGETFRHVTADLISGYEQALAAIGQEGQEGQEGSDRAEVMTTSDCTLPDEDEKRIIESAAIRAAEIIEKRMFGSVRNRPERFWDMLTRSWADLVRMPKS